MNRRLALLPKASDRRRLYLGEKPVLEETPIGRLYAVADGSVIVELPDRSIILTADEAYAIDRAIARVAGVARGREKTVAGHYAWRVQPGHDGEILVTHAARTRAFRSSILRASRLTRCCDACRAVLVAGQHVWIDAMHEPQQDALRHARLCETCATPRAPGPPRLVG